MRIRIEAEFDVEAWGWSSGQVAAVFSAVLPQIGDQVKNALDAGDAPLAIEFAEGQSYCIGISHKCEICGKPGGH